MKKRIMNIKSIKSLLSFHNAGIKQKYGVVSIGVFGSYTKGTQKKTSDIDILVEFKEGQKTFDNYMDLKFFLEDLFGVRTDLVLKNAVRKELKETIFSEAVYV